ncbi:MAG: hexapeptide repeat-containing transferase [Thermomicrobiales bacterium]|jgi:carbonic anhydrase/acetyltransferase-like protein (isoleucine patch superfamily)|nr:hexapeptide repeat-containing transferase [Thermomicrobiales bacterium]MDF3018469.1 hexapeptide repeat-containing transferase [Thermomicrobiales bacterium]
MPVRSLGDRAPQIDATAYIADGAQLIGDVVLGSGVSVWFNAVLRGDTERISVGAGSNVQDGAILHADPGFPCTVGTGVVTGHGAILHGCQIGDDCLIGMGAVVLNGAKIGPGSIVAAGAVVPEGKEFPPRSLIMGVPAKVVREATTQDLEQIAAGARHYQERARLYQAELGEESASR